MGHYQGLAQVVKGSRRFQVQVPKGTKIYLLEKKKEKNHWIDHATFNCEITGWILMLTFKG